MDNSKTAFWVIIIIIVIVLIIAAIVGSQYGKSCGCAPYVAISDSSVNTGSYTGDVTNAINGIKGKIATSDVKGKLAAGGFSFASLLALFGLGKASSVTTASSVDLDKYAGDWYEVEAFPFFFEKGCVDSRANYQILPDGQVQIVNSCVRNGKVESVTGKGKAIPESNNSKLKVSFDGMPFSGDYWILDVDPDYQWALVGTPDKRYLWILGRTPELDPATLAGIKATAKAKGFDVSRLQVAKV